MGASDEIIKILRKYGTEVQKYTSRKTPGLYTYICPGCGKMIRSDDTETMKDVEYAVNKRGSATLFHNKCYLKTWNGGIR